MLKWFQIVAGCILVYFGVLAILLLCMPRPNLLSSKEIAAWKTKRTAQQKQIPDAPAWDFSKQTASKKAIKLMPDDFYWSLVDDFSPFGNDDGGDALFNYHSWKRTHPKATAMAFVEETAVDWQAPLETWRRLKSTPLSILPFDRDGYILHTDDQMIIGTAFAQLVMEGRIDSDLQRLASKAIVNEQSLPLWHFLNPFQRQERLKKMLEVVNKAND